MVLKVKTGSQDKKNEEHWTINWTKKCVPKLNNLITNVYFSDIRFTACLACEKLLHYVVHCNLNEYSIDERNVKTKMAVSDIPKWRKA